VKGISICLILSFIALSYCRQNISTKYSNISNKYFASTGVDYRKNSSINESDS